MAGALATLCFVALSAGRGQLWFHDTRVASRAVVSDVSVPAVPAASAADAPFDAIVKYLDTGLGETERAIAYRGAPIIAVDSSPLRRLFPDMRFFTTKVHRGELERGVVELLVLIRQYAGQDVILSCTAATCARPLDVFLSQFKGVRAPTIESRREVALAMAELLAKLMHAGKAHSSTEWFKGTGAEIWQGRRHWRDVDVLTESGVVSGIAIGNPSEHRIDTVVWP
jgi:hypothetical protein